MKRKDDKNNQVCYRSNRMFEDSGNWYFNSRNGEVFGPFRDELHASTQLEVYIRMVDSGLMPKRQQFPMDPVAVKNAG